MWVVWAFLAAIGLSLVLAYVYWRLGVRWLPVIHGGAAVAFALLFALLLWRPSLTQTHAPGCHVVSILSGGDRCAAGCVHCDHCGAEILYAINDLVLCGCGVTAIDEWAGIDACLLRDLVGRPGPAAWRGTGGWHGDDGD